MKQARDRRRIKDDCGIGQAEPSNEYAERAPDKDGEDDFYVAHLDDIYAFNIAE